MYNKKLLKNLYKIKNLIKRKIEGFFIHKELKKINNDRYDFTNIMERKTIDILKYAKNHVPYYNMIFNNKNINIKKMEEFKRIPLLDKSIIREENDDITSNELKKVLHYNMNTGGTTGDPLEFPMSYHFDYEHQLMGYKLMGYVSGDKIVCFDGTRIDETETKENKFWKNKSKNDLPYGRKAYSTIYLNDKNIKYYIEDLLKETPKIIRGYPSALNYISQYILENDIRINISLKGIQLTSETINYSQINNIKSAFNTKVFLQYGHSEASIFAYTRDESYRYYCSPLYGYTEILNENGEHVKKGEIGEIVVTGFYNKALPFIRYRTKDLAEYGGRERGIVKLNKIIGRKQEVLYNKDGKKIYLIGLIYGGHKQFLNNIKRWQIIQNQKGEIIINILKRESFNHEDKNEIKKMFKNRGISSKINFVQSINLTKRGKEKFIIQNLKDG
jgi:phenylacetate-CoA ligase